MFAKLEIIESFSKQVNNITYDALMKAHQNMGFIQGNLQEVPPTMVNIVRTLTEGTPEDVECMLGEDIKFLRGVAHRGRVKAQEVVEKFDVVTKTLGELLSAGEQTRGRAKQAELDAKSKLSHKQREYETRASLWKKAEEERAEVKESVKKADEKFDKEVDSTGSVGELEVRLASYPFNLISLSQSAFTLDTCSSTDKVDRRHGNGRGRKARRESRGENSR